MIALTPDHILIQGIFGAQTLSFEAGEFLFVEQSCEHPLKHKLVRDDRSFVEISHPHSPVGLDNHRMAGSGAGFNPCLADGGSEF